MTPDEEILKLSVKEQREPIKANVAWLKMVYEHLCSKDVENAIVYIEDMIYKSVGKP